MLVTICSALLGGVLIYKATHNEITGSATYYTGRKSDKGEPVTRENSPDKFRRATNVYWATGSLCLLVSALGFMFFRRLDDCVAEPF